ncbi:hypothetical protein EHS13_07310 [Paenibacillus psychroresistens]|uniref:Uncharacterized protein n=1 Tax=Paenibacillus psychroresistens TaxID=1778678 RepID=A0A6B8RFI9_9BACL|nr:hypothetical protein [Paenibacillus psychroresistens]QGQ94707.1 hypothetical protein EHS13_07310 [Paenibacillus psychroresistens]
MLIILGYIAAIVVLISAVMLTRSYMHKNRKIFVNGAPPNLQKGSFFSKQYGLYILILTPIIFGIAWFIGWLYSR